MFIVLSYTMPMTCSVCVRNLVKHQVPLSPCQTMRTWFLIFHDAQSVQNWSLCGIDLLWIPGYRLDGCWWFGGNNQCIVGWCAAIAPKVNPKVDAMHVPSYLPGNASVYSNGQLEFDQHGLWPFSFSWSCHISMCRVWKVEFKGSLVVWNDSVQ